MNLLGKIGDKAGIIDHGQTRRETGKRQISTQEIEEIVTKGFRPAETYFAMITTGEVKPTLINSTLKFKDYLEEKRFTDELIFEIYLQTRMSETHNNALLTLTREVMKINEAIESVNKRLDELSKQLKKTLTTTA